MESEGIPRTQNSSFSSFLKQPLPASRTANSNPPLDRIQTIADRYGLLKFDLDAPVRTEHFADNLARYKNRSFLLHEAIPRTARK